MNIVLTPEQKTIQYQHMLLPSRKTASYKKKKNGRNNKMSLSYPGNSALCFNILSRLLTVQF